MEAEIAGALAQFGVAGLVGWMWLTERRAAAGRERQLTEAHDRLMAERERAETLVGLVAASTRAMTALEASQRELARVVERLAGVLGPGVMPVPGRAAG
jgi:nitrate reductase gamma subunit